MDHQFWIKILLKQQPEVKQWHCVLGWLTAFFCKLHKNTACYKAISKTYGTLMALCLAAALQNLYECFPIYACFSLELSWYVKYFLSEVMVSIHLGPPTQGLINIRGVAREQKSALKNLPKCTTISLNQHKSIDIITLLSWRGWAQQFYLQITCWWWKSADCSKSLWRNMKSL